HTKAEADFATSLMMAKLGGFDDLPSNAQNFLINYRTRLETMSEADSTALAIRDVYSAYYIEMGGVGAAPEPKTRTQTTEGKVVRSQTQRKSQPGLVGWHCPQIVCDVRFSPDRNQIVDIAHFAFGPTSGALK